MHSENGSILPPQRECRASSAQMGCWDRRSLTGDQVRDREVRVGLGGVIFLLIFGRWTRQHILQENTNVLICVLIVRGTHPCAAHCAKGCVGGMNNGMEEEDQ